jgi:hypothetical protein
MLVAVAYEAYQVDRLLGILAALRERDGLRGVLVSPFYLPLTEKYRRRAEAAGLGFLLETTALGGLHDWETDLSQRKSVPVKRPEGRDRYTARQATARAIAALASALKLQPFVEQLKAAEQELTERVQSVGRILDYLDPGLILLAEHNIERDSAIWINEGQARGIKTLIVSSSGVTPTEPARTYFDDVRYHAESGANRVLRWLSPRWAFRYEGRRMLRLPAGRAVALEALGLAPPRPWSLNSGPVDAIAVESERHRRLWVATGIRNSRLHVTGSPVFDELAEGMQNREARRLDLRQQRTSHRASRVVVSALPPNQYPQRQARGFVSFGDLAYAWASALAASRRFTVVISPHPTLSETDLEPVTAVSGVQVVRRPAAELIPLADLYVASVSSTIKWSLACGIPVIDCDVYGYDYDEYRDAEGVLRVATVSEMRRLTERLAHEDEALEVLQDRAELHAESWGILDGQASRRIRELIVALSRPDRMVPG